MWITIDQLITIQAVHESGSITAASENLHKAKSAIYYAIKKLESQVGFEILENDGYRARLTPKGEQLLSRANTFLKQYDALKTDILQIASGVETHLAISATALFSLKKFNALIHKIQSQFPNTQIVFHREILSGLQFLKQDLVDLAIFERRDSREDLEIKKIDSVIMQLVISKSHPLTKLPKKERTLDRLLEFPQVIQRSTMPTDESHGVHKNSRQWTVTDLDSKKEIILSGLGWGRLPIHEIEKELKSGKLLRLENIEAPQEISLFIGRKRMKTPGVVSQALWEMLGP
ncbi:MAG: LysR family transcriptional regulator [Bdellovibrionales bacterium]|nr:LysR family transcriptional regulator [Bdellovibrionales bacterium]